MLYLFTIHSVHLPVPSGPSGGSRTRRYEILSAAVCVFWTESHNAWRGAQQILAQALDLDLTLTGSENNPVNTHYTWASISVGGYAVVSSVFVFFSISIS